MKKTVRNILFPALGILAVTAFALFWHFYASPTRVAFVNYPEYILAPLLDQEINPSVEAVPLQWNEKSGRELKGFDCVIFFGMGLKFTEEQQEISVPVEEEDVWKSIGITFSYAGIMVPLGLVLSFIVALFLNQGLKGIGVFRLLYYIPCLIPSIVQSMIYLYIFNPNYGVMNDIFAGLGFEKSQFFDSPNYNAVLTFMFMNLFGVGGSMLIWLAGLKSVPQTYYEAAKIEGGGYFYSLVRITIPLCSPYIFYLLITNVIATLQICGNAYMISSSGGVDNNLLFFGLYIYRTFMNNNFGYSSALAYLLFIVIAALSALLFRFNKYVYYEGDN